MFYLYVHFKDSFGTEDHVLPPKTMFWRFRAHMRSMQNCVWKNQIWARHLLKTQHPDSSMFHMFHCTGLKDLSKQLAINWCWWHVPFKHVSWLVVSKCWFYIPCVFFYTPALVELLNRTITDGWHWPGCSRVCYGQRHGLFSYQRGWSWIHEKGFIYPLHKIIRIIYIPLYTHSWTIRHIKIMVDGHPGVNILIRIIPSWLWDDHAPFVPCKSIWRLPKMGAPPAFRSSIIRPL